MIGHKIRRPVPHYLYTLLFLSSGVVYLIFTYHQDAVKLTISAHQPEMQYEAETWRASSEFVEWKQMRQKLLRKGPKKLLLFTYMRGGSSILGEMFNRDPRVVYWYEPLAAFYMAYYGVKFASIPQRVLYTKDMKGRILFNTVEQKRLADYFADMFSCRYTELPTLAWTHPFVNYSMSGVSQAFTQCALSGRSLRTIETCGHVNEVCEDMEDSKIRHCPDIISETKQIIDGFPTEKSESLTVEHLNDMLQKYMKRNKEIPRWLQNSTNIFASHLLCMNGLQNKHVDCLDEAERRCDGAEIHAAKVNRIKMEEVECIIRTVPDVHVLHYVRDPRSIAVSRTQTNALMIDPANKSALIEVDFLCRRIRKDIAIRRELEKKYPGVIHHLKYEDFVLDPTSTARAIFSFLGKEVSEEFLSFARVTFRTGEGTLYKWKNKISPNDLHQMITYCSDLFQDLGYPFA